MEPDNPLIYKDEKSAVKIHSQVSPFPRSSFIFPSSFSPRTRFSVEEWN